MKKLFIAFTILISSLGMSAQHHEIGLFGGVSYYMGDLTPQPFSIPGYNFGLSYRYTMGPRFALKLAGHYGQVHGDSKYDSKSKRYKNLSFSTQLVDIEAGLEINFLEYVPGSSNHRFTPYIFGGIAVFKFNPTAVYQGKQYELQPLGTEGQGLTAYPESKPYKLTAFAIPFGFGFKISVSSRLSLGLEYGMRKTFTDYLDDVSTRYPNPTVLRAEKGAVAAALANRQYEDEALQMGLDISIGPNGIPSNPVDFDKYMEMHGGGGGQRGLDNNDWYTIAGITIMFKIVGPRKGTCPAYQKHNYFKEYLLF